MNKRQILIAAENIIDSTDEFIRSNDTDAARAWDRATWKIEGLKELVLTAGLSIDSYEYKKLNTYFMIAIRNTRTS